MGTIAVQVLKDRSGNRSLGNVSEIHRGGTALPRYRNGDLVGGGTGKPVGVGLLDRVCAGGDTGERVGAIAGGGLGIGLLAISRDQSNGHAAESTLPGLLNRVAVQVLKDLSRNGADGHVTELHHRGPVAHDRDRDLIRGRADKPIQVGLRDRVSPGDDIGEQIRPVDNGGRGLRHAIRIGQRHRDQTHAALVGILGAVTIQILKDRSGDRALHQVSEIRRSGTAAADADGDLVGRGACKAGRILLPNGVCPGFDAGKRVGTVTICGGQLCHAVRINPSNRHLRDAALAGIPFAVAVHILKDHAGDRALGDVPEIRGRGACAPDGDGDRVGRGADESFRIGLLNGVGPGRGVAEAVGAIHHGRDLLHRLARGIHQLEDGPGDPGFADIPGSVAIHVLKDRSGHLPLGNVPETDGC